MLMLSKIVEYRTYPRKHIKTHLEDLLLVNISKVECLVLYDSLHYTPIKHGKTQTNIEAIIVRKLYCKHLLVSAFNQSFIDLVFRQFWSLIHKSIVEMCSYLLDIIASAH